MDEQLDLALKGSRVFKGSVADKKAIAEIAKLRGKGLSGAEAIKALNEAKIAYPGAAKLWGPGNYYQYCADRRSKINRAIGDGEGTVKKYTRSKRTPRMRSVRKPEVLQVLKSTTKDTIMHLLTDPNINDSKRVRMLIEYVR